ncbi:hypothetical protein OAO87_02160 [bacterium]|nr:hypothetical protein [bacterium]
MKFWRTHAVSRSTSEPPPRIRPRHQKLPPLRLCAFSLMTWSGCGAQKVSSSGSVSESSDTCVRTGSGTGGSAAISSGGMMRAALHHPARLRALRSAAAARSSGEAYTFVTIVLAIKKPPSFTACKS